MHTSTPQAPIVYEKGKEAHTRWGHWIVCANPLTDDKGTVTRCEKIITVNPGASLSAQLHFGRGEIYKWVAGTTHVMVNGKIYVLEKEGDTVIIPRGSIHFSWNADPNTPAVFHEIQEGPLCDEADIMRCADRYKKPEDLNSTEEIVTLLWKVMNDRAEKEGFHENYPTYDFMHNVRLIANAYIDGVKNSKCAREIKTYFEGLVKISRTMHNDNTPVLTTNNMKDHNPCA